MRPCISAPLLLLSMLSIVSCATGKKNDPVESFKQQQEQKKLEQARVTDPFLASQQDVELGAVWMQPGKLQVTVSNKTGQVLEIVPECFGLILPPSREIQPPLPESRRSFPIVRLKPGEQASGLLVFKPVAGEEQRLAFRHPHARPAMARIP